MPVGGVIGGGDAPGGDVVEHAIDDQRRGHHAAIGVQVGKPGEPQALHVLVVDLLERAEALFVPGAAVGHPLPGVLVGVFHARAVDGGRLAGRPGGRGSCRYRGQTDDQGEKTLGIRHGVRTGLMVMWKPASYCDTSLGAEAERAAVQSCGASRATPINGGLSRLVRMTDLKRDSEYGTSVRMVGGTDAAAMRIHDGSGDCEAYSESMRLGRYKRRKQRVDISPGKPGPVSRTEISTLARLTSMPIVMRRRSGGVSIIASMAFMIRFTNTCCSSTGSPLTMQRVGGKSRLTSTCRARMSWETRASVSLMKSCRSTGFFCSCRLRNIDCYGP